MEDEDRTDWFTGSAAVSADLESDWYRPTSPVHLSTNQSWPEEREFFLPELPSQVQSIDLNNNPSTEYVTRNIRQVSRRCETQSLRHRNGLKLVN
jgi:hypothetical protein